MRNRNVKASLKFLADKDAPAVYIPSKGGGDTTEHLGNYVIQDVLIENARDLDIGTDLDAEGFRLVHQYTQVTNFYDEEQVTTVFYPEVTGLIKRHTGASRVEIFDHTRRASSVARQQERKVREAASIVHNDYTAASGVKRFIDHFASKSHEAESLLHKRFAIINVWRSMAGTIVTQPLTLCDAKTIAPKDLVSVERQSSDRKGELQLALHDPHQRWYYFPEMEAHEALLFKTFDSATDGRTRFTIHSSFDHPQSPKDAPSRESIEVRCLVFF